MELLVINHGVEQNQLAPLCQPECIGQRVQLQVDHAGTRRGALQLLYAPILVFVESFACASLNRHRVPKSEQHLAVFGFHAFHQFGPWVEHLVGVVGVNIQPYDGASRGCL